MENWRRFLNEEKCWKGYSPGAKSGVKTKKGKGGKRVNNCEPIDEEVTADEEDELEDIKGELKGASKKHNKQAKQAKDIAQASEKSRDAHKRQASDIERIVKEEELEEKKSAAWQRKAGKNKEGGLNKKGRESYEKENPGSDLKAPTKKKGNKRRKSFCARMKGMKKKRTSKKTARDPDSRINKSLRKWDC
jgi:hypothetical protein